MMTIGELADMYDGGGDFTRSIDKAGGSGHTSILSALKVTHS